MIKNDELDFISFLGFKERPFRAKFCPNAVFVSLDRCKNDARKLRNLLKKFKIRVIHEDCSEVTVGGGFGEDDGITLHIFGDYDGTEFTDEEWFMFKFRLVQTTMHELIHWRQFDSRGHDRSRVLNYVSKHKDAPYYSTLDEVHAFSHCMYLEMRREYPELSMTQIISEYGGETYDHIFNVVFENNEENEALNRYKKEILRWEKIYK